MVEKLQVNLEEGSTAYLSSSIAWGSMSNPPLTQSSLTTTLFTTSSMLMTLAVQYCVLPFVPKTACVLYWVLCFGNIYKMYFMPIQRIEFTELSWGTDRNREGGKNREGKRGGQRGEGRERERGRRAVGLFSHPLGEDCVRGIKTSCQAHSLTAGERRERETHCTVHWTDRSKLSTATGCLTCLCAPMEHNQSCVELFTSKDVWINKWIIRRIKWYLFFSVLMAVEQVWSFPNVCECCALLQCASKPAPRRRSVDQPSLVAWEEQYESAERLKYCF